MCCWIEFASSLLTFASIFIRHIGRSFFSMWCFCMVLVLEWHWLPSFLKHLYMEPRKSLFLYSLLPQWLLLLNHRCWFLISPTSKCLTQALNLFSFSTFTAYMTSLRLIVLNTIYVLMALRFIPSAQTFPWTPKLYNNYLFNNSRWMFQR